jgi:hypothetical protein
MTLAAKLSTGGGQWVLQTPFAANEYFIEPLQLSDADREWARLMMEVCSSKGRRSSLAMRPSRSTPS